MVAPIVVVAALAVAATGCHGASTAGPSSAIDIPRAMVNTLQGNLPLGTQRLIVMQGFQDFIKNIVPFICKGKPALVAHTPTLGPNGACFAGTAWSTLESNLSCTCLTYTSDADWAFSIQNTPLAEQVEKKLPLEQANETILNVDSSMIYGVAPSVKTLKLIGVGPTRVPITLMNNPIQGPKTDIKALIISQAEATITTLYVENIEFNTPIADGFVPTIVQNLTMKNCNISSFSTDIVTKSLALSALDLSNNSIRDALKGASSSTLTTLNLASNNISTFPSWLLGFQRLSNLSLLNNPLNRSVDSVSYETMKSQLKSLNLDPIKNCSEAKESSGSSTTYLIIGLIVGCIIIVILVVVLIKKKSWHSNDGPDITKDHLEDYFDNTLSYDDTHPTVSASLLNDPIIITNRIPYNDIRVANCISKGGFGLVYSGVYNRRRVAIKKIRPDRAGDIKMIESFLKEICLMATLHHPHIVEFVGVSWDSLRNLCAVTEFMDRGDLRDVLHGFKLRNTPLTWDSHKTKIALHIAEGLTYLHSLSPKVIHRDLKSKNVLLNNEMEAKLSDFGISRERHIEETHMTAGIGTSFWIAPEVLLGKDYDERADIFSFGVVLSEIDTDDYPYWNASNPNVGNKAQENMILQMVASGAMRPSFSDSCPKEVLELADLCLKTDPSERPTAAEVAYRLQQMVQFLNPHSRSGVST